ncbi:hypothetical protein BS78_09G258700 [Paspalum vaginatum]|nr:hypothetical protein BS78_09G258700 [Paspalum vaginatum]KAJ1264378.1 hypothetical protein BS78_09G258700 [Paspalum vaginatum]KAJ1264379.1 hypothetical protein BS78_09G258700 [Paspalum vaginatum]
MNRLVTTMNETEDSPFQGVGDDDSKHGETSICSTPYLPEEIWHHIHSLMPIRDAARAACLSQTFLRSWRCYPNLTLDLYSLCVKPSQVVGLISTIDSIMRNHSGTGLKIFKLSLDLYGDYHRHYVDSWLWLAVTPGIEELTLAHRNRRYSFPCSLLSDGVRNSIRYLKLGFCAFHPTVELGPMRCLTSLYLHDVHVMGDELECLISNSLALEELDLYGCHEIVFLKIPCGLQRLSFVGVMSCCGVQMIECKAPNLSRLDHDSTKTRLLLGEASQLKDFTLYDRNSVYYARAELPSIMPNLEKLALSSYDEVNNTPTLPTKFLYLKDLSIAVTSGAAFSPSYDYFSLVSFLDASPSLETLFLDVSQDCMEHESMFGSSSHLRQLPECRHGCLKSVEIIGFSSAKGLVELTCCIVKSAVSLERLVLDPLRDTVRCYGKNGKICWPMSKTVLEEAFRAVEAIRTYIEDEVPTTASLTVVEPCARCYSRG